MTAPSLISRVAPTPLITNVAGRQASDFSVIEMRSDDALVS